MCVTNDEVASNPSSTKVCCLCQALTEGVELQLKVGEWHQSYQSHQFQRCFLSLLIQNSGYDRLLLCC